MTLVLATVCRDGIAFAYDKLSINGGGLSTSLVDKVLIVDNLAVGVAGSFCDGFDGVISDFNQAYGAVPEIKILDALERRKSKYGFLGNIEENIEDYLVGVSEKRTRLYSGSIGANDLTEILCGGIGSGFYPEIERYLKRHFKYERTLEDAVEFLNEGMQMAFELNESDSCKLLGLGFTIVTEEGIRRKTIKQRSLLPFAENLGVREHLISIFNKIPIKPQKY